MPGHGISKTSRGAASVLGYRYESVPSDCGLCSPSLHHDRLRPSHSRDWERAGERGNLAPLAARLIFDAMFGKVVSQSRPQLAWMSFLNLIPNLEIADCFTPAVRVNRRRPQLNDACASGFCLLETANLSRKALASTKQRLGAAPPKGGVGQVLFVEPLGGVQERLWIGAPFLFWSRTRESPHHQGLR